MKTSIKNKSELQKIMLSNECESNKVIQVTKILDYNNLYRISKEVGVHNFCTRTSRFRKSDKNEKTQIRDTCATDVRRAYAMGAFNHRQRISELLVLIADL